MKNISAEPKRADVVIIGGGASGLAAAAELGNRSAGFSVAIIEKNDDPGRKIRATGSGRCNITNTSAEGYIEIMEFFRRIGLVTKSYENGLVYPYSESAADVADLLTARATETGSELITGAEALSVRKDEQGFITDYKVRVQGGRQTVRSIRSDYVILALGGKAGPTYGTTGDGYRIARELGHSIVTPVPVLTGVECREWSDQGGNAVTLAGTRTRGVVTLLRRDGSGRAGDKLFREAGEIQFTRFGLSGICVFNMTRFMRYDRKAGESLADFVIRADLFPDGNIEDFLRDRRENALPSEKCSDVLRTVLKANIAKYVVDRAGAKTRSSIADKPVIKLTDADITALAGAVHSLEFSPEGIRGWKEAQATSGGVSTDEIWPETSESKLVRGLFITGELADRDFPCGGFNLSNAWITGLAAARSIAAGAELQK
ncbi:MAG: aminoacetone oxidase family FAD-binding enzyme [Mogibacterium sp.]|nr:aminoacetone oxidase family FAD-binding enzyme [Mogibacterium sp.]